MEHCKNCGTKLGDTDNFCKKCGTQVNTKLVDKHSKNKVEKKQAQHISPTQKNVLPALLSFFLPGLGQFVKGEVKWGLMIWLWFGLGNLFIVALSGLLGWLTVIILVVFNLFMWIYQIYEAYNSPQKA